jgi:hypothetical protein
VGVLCAAGPCLSIEPAAASSRPCTASCAALATWEQILLGRSYRAVIERDQLSVASGSPTQRPSSPFSRNASDRARLSHTVSPSSGPIEAASVTDLVTGGYSKRPLPETEGASDLRFY